MNFKNKMLFLLSERVVRKNIKFKDIHRGESCYLFGNGASIKYFDLKKFDDKPSIGCGGLFLHKDFNELKVKYFYEGPIVKRLCATRWVLIIKKRRFPIMIFYSFVV